MTSLTPIFSPQPWIPTSPFHAVGFLGADDEEECLGRELARRAKLYAKAKDDREFREGLRAKASRDVEFFFDNFVFTYDPRRLKHYPMVLWPRQREYLRALEQVLEEGGDLFCEKSRDCGVTYLNVGFAVHRFLFSPGFSTGFCANQQHLVDELGNPDTILEKARMILRRLPSWMRPAGFDVAKDCMVCRFVNEAIGTTIIGEGGLNAGRGGRSTLYVIDEAAHVDKADVVNASTSANAKARIWCSSVNGSGNFFAKQRHKSGTRVFTFHWRDDPRKDDTWAEAEKRRIGAIAFAQEYDIDYGASIDRLVIPKAWIDASLALRRLLEAGGIGPTRRPIVGADVGKGVAENVLIAVRGPWVDAPVAWRDSDTSQTAYRALRYCFELKAEALHYDSVGVGEGLTATFARSEDARLLTIQGISTGLPATERIWPDEKTSREKFANLKAELWWTAREKLRRTYEHWQHINGKPDGMEHDLAALLLLPDDDDLNTQLNTPKWFDSEGRRVQIETKQQLKTRGIDSPDRADALMLALYEAPLEPLWLGDLAI